MDWLTERIEWLIVVGVLGIPSLIQISPLKINPWSSLSKAIKKLLYGDVLMQINEINAKLDGHIKDGKEENAITRRARILRFNDEIRIGQRHTKEHFNQILKDITDYNNYCRDNEDFKNEQAVEAIEHIRRVYRHCEDTDSFL